VTALAHSGGWSLAASMALALLALVLRDGRRRALINEALHELRRPLQAIALSTDLRRGGATGGFDGSVRLAANALERLDRAVNGGPFGRAREAVRCESLLRSAVGRWRARVALGGGSLELRWWAGEAIVEGDRDALEGAVDNLIVNAIEHGGPAILVEGRRREGRLRIVVADSGFAAPRPRRPGLVDDSDRGQGRPLPAGRGRRGHGLTVVRRVAAEHRGRFVLRRSPSGSMAVLEVPLRCEQGEPVAHA
jgi:K+-sensing histidine kinase KdpD